MQTWQSQNHLVRKNLRLHCSQAHFIQTNNCEQSYLWNVKFNWWSFVGAKCVNFIWYIASSTEVSYNYFSDMILPRPHIWQVITTTNDNFNGHFTRWCVWKVTATLRWRHNGRDRVSNHHPHDCLLNRLFRRENIKAPRHWPLCGEFTGDRWIPRTNCQ